MTTPMSRNERSKKRTQHTLLRKQKDISQGHSSCAECYMAERDDEETDVTEELGYEAQHQLMAFVAVDQMKGKGKNKGKGFGKKGGKGKDQGKHVLRTQRSVQDRLARLAKLKAVSKCLRCGGRGHWAGDPACKFRKQSDQVCGGSLTSKATAYYALSDDDSSSEVDDEY